MLYGWMKSLIVYLIFAGAIINLSPSGDYKKYIRLFTGLVAIIIIVKPISYIFNYDEKSLYGVMDEIRGLGNYNVEDVEHSTIQDYYHMGLMEGIKIELEKRGYMIEDVSVITDKDNQLVSCGVVLSKESDIDVGFEENNIKKYINEVYNLDEDNIYIVRR